MSSGCSFTTAQLCKSLSLPLWQSSTAKALRQGEAYLCLWCKGGKSPWWSKAQHQAGWQEQEAESSHSTQVQRREIKLEMGWNFKFSRATPSDKLLLSRPHILPPPRHHKLVTKCSNIWAQGGNSHSNHLTSIPRWCPNSTSLRTNSGSSPVSNLFTTPYFSYRHKESPSYAISNLRDLWYLVKQQPWKSL